MILIDRTLEAQIIIVTLDGISDTNIIYLKNDAERSEFEIELGDNLSEHRSRYDKFEVPTTSFEDMPEGFYSYKILAMLDGSIIEEGKLLIKDVEPEQIPSAPDLSNEYKVFTK